MNPWGSPGWIFAAKPTNQTTKLGIDASTTAFRPRFPTPVIAEASAMPTGVQSTREAAYEKLFAKMNDYYDLLYAKQEDKTVSLEVLTRIKKLLTTSKVKEASQLDSVVSVLRLADDAEYLDELKGIVNAEQRESIERRLESLKQ